MAPTLRCSLLLLAVLGLAACTSGGGNDPAPAATEKLSATAALGEKIFDDTSLSASGQVACASCHERARAFAGDTVVPIGGVGMDVQGFRNAPSLKYLTQNPAFFFDGEGTPTGGFDRDGRAASLAKQARRPFLAAHEMANASVADVIDKLSRAAYAADLPADLTVNVNTTEPPYDRGPGDLPALTEPEIQDVVAFLQTLTDGFTL